MDMDNIENQSPAPSDNNQLHAELAALRLLVNKVLILLIVVSGTLGIFLYRQYRTTHAQAQMMGPRVQRLAEAFQRNEAPQLQAFLNRIVDYSRTHPDFAPILAKYGITGAPGAIPTAPSVPSVRPAAPARPPAATKKP
jgi:hypothetical protein